MLILEVATGQDRGEQLRFDDQQQHVIGRYSLLRALPDPKISRQHARIVRTARGWFIEDLGSRNGTFVNDHRVTEPTRLYEADQVRLGRMVFKVSVTDEFELAAAPPKPTGSAEARSAVPPTVPSPPPADEKRADVAEPTPTGPAPLDATDDELHDPWGTMSGHEPAEPEALRDALDAEILDAPPLPEFTDETDEATVTVEDETTRETPDDASEAANGTISAPAPTPAATDAAPSTQAEPEVEHDIESHEQPTSPPLNEPLLESKSELESAPDTEAVSERELESDAWISQALEQATEAEAVEEIESIEPEEAEDADDARQIAEALAESTESEVEGEVEIESLPEGAVEEDTSPDAVSRIVPAPAPVDVTPPPVPEAESDTEIESEAIETKPEPESEPRREPATASRPTPAQIDHDEHHLLSEHLPLAFKPAHDERPSDPQRYRQREATAGKSRRGRRLLVAALVILALGINAVVLIKLIQSVQYNRELVERLEALEAQRLTLTPPTESSPTAPSPRPAAPAPAPALQEPDPRLVEAPAVPDEASRHDRDPVSRAAPAPIPAGASPAAPEATDATDAMRPGPPEPDVAVAAVDDDRLASGWLEATPIQVPRTPPRTATPARIVHEAIAETLPPDDATVTATSPTDAAPPTAPDEPEPDTVAAPITIAPNHEPARPDAVDNSPEPDAARQPASLAEAQRVVFLVDASGSLIDTLPLLIRELELIINRLHEPQRFTVIFFQDERALEPPPTGLRDATDLAKRAVSAWMRPGAGNVVAAGRSDPGPAIRAAFALQPDQIFILGDNLTCADNEALGLLDRLNADSDVQINTIQFFYRGQQQRLQQIARTHGGTYRFVSERDLSPTAPADPDTPITDSLLLMLESPR